MNKRSKYKRGILGACTAAGLLLAAPGCGKANEEITESTIETSMPNGGDVEYDSGSGDISIQTTDGEGGAVGVQAGESVALPDNFPADIPVPDGVTWKLVQNASTGGKSGVTAQGMLQTPVADVAAFVKEETAKEGWTSEQSFQQAGQMEMMTFKKEERMLHITLTGTDDGTAIVISSQ